MQKILNKYLISPDVLPKHINPPKQVLEKRKIVQKTARLPHNPKPEAVYTQNPYSSKPSSVYKSQADSMFLQNR